MKRIVMTLCTVAMCFMAANAQKTEVKKYYTTQQSYSETQARMVEITARSYAMPLIAEVEVQSEQMKTLRVRYSNAEVDGMNNNAQNLRSRKLYDATNAVFAFYPKATERPRFYLFIIAGLAMLIGVLPSALGLPSWLAFLLAFGVLWLVVRLVGKKV